MKKNIPTKSISLQKWVKIMDSKKQNNFVLFGKNNGIQTDKQVLQKFYKIYSQIF